MSFGSKRVRCAGSGESTEIGYCLRCHVYFAPGVLPEHEALVRIPFCVHDLGGPGCGVDLSMFPEGSECDKTVETCRNVFDNFERFGDFPHIPGSTPRSSSTNP